MLLIELFWLCTMAIAIFAKDKETRKKARITAIAMVLLCILAVLFVSNISA